MASFYPPFQPTPHVIPMTPPIEPKLYLDTNIILDVIRKRWIPSVTLFERIKSERWKCITSRFTFLEMLDTEHEQCYIDNLVAEGRPLSKVRGLLGNRYQKGHALPNRDLEKIHAFFATHSQTTFAYISFQYPIAESFWNNAEKYCDTMPISVEDAMQLAFAVESGCNILVTRDKDFLAVADDVIITTEPKGMDIALTKLNKPNL